MSRLVFSIALGLLAFACSNDDATRSSGSPSAGGTGGSAGSGGGSSSGGSAGSSGGSAGSSTGGNAGGTAPGYQPFTLADCDDGTVGTDAVGPDALEAIAGPGTVYSDEQSLDDVGRSCKSRAEADKHFFGGRFRTDGMNVGEGDDLWMRHAVYFPTGFCFGYGDKSGDGWGATKWMRIEFDNGNPSTGGPGNRLTLELGNFAHAACNDSTEIWGAAREYAGNANCKPSTQASLGTDAWHFVQWHVHMAADDSGFIRFWLDDKYLGQWDGQTLPSDKPKIAFIQYGDYWNGSPFQTVEWYVDDIIMTQQAPDTLDAEGHPFISPAARVKDWD